MSGPGSITLWLGKLKDGEREAVQPLWDVYFCRIVELARGHLRNLPRRVSDEEDVALSAFHSFCSGVGEGRFPKLSDRHNLWPLLVSITAHKCVDQIRWQTRQKRACTEAEVDFNRLISREPDPKFIAQINDELEHLLALLDRTGDADLRRIALARMDGDDVPAIAERLGCSRRTVERKLHLVARTWEEEPVS